MGVGLKKVWCGNNTKVKSYKKLTRMVEILALLKDIISKPTDEQPYEEADKEADEQPDEQSDTTDMPNLVSEASVARIRNKKGQGLKILTPDQILSRLPISLAQLKAGNNKDKLKNQIRQLLDYLYRSNTLTKRICNNLINTI